MVDAGFEYDRLFMLLKVKEDGSLQNVQITKFNQLALFKTSLDNGRLTVSYSGPEDSLPETQCVTPLHPDTDKLEMIDVDMYKSPVKAFNMGEEYSDWFSKQLGFKTILAYIGQGRRAVLGSLFPSPPEDKGILSSWLPSAFIGKKQEIESTGLTFTDCANFLVATAESNAEASSRLPDGIEMDISKFRPNIVVEGAKEAWDEDYWNEIRITSEGKEVEIPLTANCIRCMSINIDYSTGKQGTGEDGQILKKLMADRRVDKGAKFSPVFGRYGYLKKGGGTIIRIGDEVDVTKRLTETTTWGE